MAVINFNKLIDITLGDGSNALKIECPRTGRKPDITITGKFVDQAQANKVDIKIKGFYTSKINAFNTVRFSAGYEGNMSEALVGSIFNIYTESPGPDGITVISCTTADFESWLNNQVTLDLAPGFSLSDAISAIAKALGFSSFEPNSNPTAEAGLQFNGTAKDALQKLSGYFPGLNFRVSNNTVIADDEMTTTQKNTFKIDFLSSPPQYAGSGVTITAPWNPAIKVGDFITFKTGFYQTAVSTQTKTQIKDKYRVISIDFSFSTVSSENRMTIIGTAE